MTIRRSGTQQIQLNIATHYYNLCAVKWNDVPVGCGVAEKKDSKIFRKSFTPTLHLNMAIVLQIVTNISCREYSEKPRHCKTTRSSFPF